MRDPRRMDVGCALDQPYCVEGDGMGIVTAPEFFDELQRLRLPALPAVSLLRCSFRVGAYDDALFAHLGIDCPAEVQRSVRKRKAEYLAGRYLGSRLLRQHGAAPSIASGTHRQPLWPAGWVGSISHTDRSAIVCLARRESVAMLGIDLEGWLDESAANNVAGHLVNAREARLLQSAGPRTRALTLAFSAKESLFKAVYPAVGRYFDFDGAELVALDPSRQRLILRITQDLSSAVVAGQEFQAHYFAAADEVLTVVAG